MCKKVPPTPGSFFSYRVQFRPREVEAAIVLCPTCKKWFDIRDLEGSYNNIVDYMEEGKFGPDTFTGPVSCPVCGFSYWDGEKGPTPVIAVHSGSDVLDLAVKKKVIWE